MRAILSIPFLFLGIQAYSHTPLKTNADLSNVLVYRSGAEMSHKAKLSLPAGSSEVVINNVANTIDEKTIQVGSTANITILSVRFAKDYLKEAPKSLEYTLWEDSVKQLKKAMVKWDNQRQAEQSVLDLLEKNSTIRGVNTGVSVAELMKLAEYYKSKQLETNNNLTTLDELVTLQQTSIAKLESQMLELRNQNTSNGGQIILQVMAKNAAPTDFNISYISPNAGWNAFYDLRADKINEPLKLIYKANVKQNTGVDWKKVKLVLSTGNPSLNGTAPTIMPWFLAFQHTNYTGSADEIEARKFEKTPISDFTKALEGAAPGIQITNGSGAPGSSASVQIRGRGSLSASTTPLYVVDGVPYEGDPIEINSNDVANVTVLKDQQATSLYGARGANGVILITTRNRTLSSYTTQNENDLNTTFDIDLPYDIASNGKPNSVSLQEHTIPAHYQYMAIPKLDPDAFLMADITDYEKLNLLAGEGNVIFENKYVGKSFLNPGSTNDTLNLSMGRDKQIIVKREKVADLTGSKFLGSSKKQTFTYEIKIRNGKKEAIGLLLKDQYPVSTNKDLEIELLQSDGASVDKETGILSWQLKIAPGETRKIRISYSVKSPSNKVLENI